MLEIICFSAVGLVFIGFICAIVSGRRPPASRKRFNEGLGKVLITLKYRILPAASIVFIIIAMINTARYLIG